MNEELEKSRRETRDAYKNRAILYRLFYEEFSKEIGEDRATSIMKQAIYRWGGLKSNRFKHFAENKDFKGVAEEFIRSSVCKGELFKPQIEKTDNRSAVIDMLNCPLVEAWKEMDLSDKEIAKMCEIANATDFGKYEGMGFRLTIEKNLAKNDDRCRLLIENK